MGRKERLYLFFFTHFFLLYSLFATVLFHGFIDVGESELLIDLRALL